MNGLTADPADFGLEDIFWLLVKLLVSTNEKRVMKSALESQDCAFRCCLTEKHPVGGKRLLLHSHHVDLNCRFLNAARSKAHGKKTALRDEQTTAHRQSSVISPLFP